MSYTVSVERGLVTWRGSYCHEKSWNLKMHLPGLEKSWILGKMAEVMEKPVMEFHFFGPKILCCLKTGKIIQVTEQKHAPTRLDFQHFWVTENLNWSWKSLWKVIEFFFAQFMIEPWQVYLTLLSPLKAYSFSVVLNLWSNKRGYY